MGTHGRGSEQHDKGYLGIEFHDVPQAGLGFFHWRSGHEVEIVMLDHDGPAGKAGLLEHDLILGLNGQAVSGAEELRQKIHDAGAGAIITLSVMRAGQPMTLTAQLETREDVERRAWKRVNGQPPVLPDDVDTDAARTAPVGSAPSLPGRSKHFLGEVLHGPSIGLHLQTMPAQLSLYFGAPASTGLLIESVEPASPAALAGLAAGDVILRADTVTLHTLSDWSKRLHASKGRPVALVVLRERHEVAITLQPNGSHSSLEWTLRAPTAGPLFSLGCNCNTTADSLRE